MTARERFELLLGNRAGERFRMKLFVTGLTERSCRAIDNLKKVCEEKLKGNYDLEVVDICQRPDLSRTYQVLAAPMLIKENPLPRKLLVGDMSNRQMVLKGLGLTN